MSTAQTERLTRNVSNITASLLQAIALAAVYEHKRPLHPTLPALLTLLSVEISEWIPDQAETNAGSGMSLEDMLDQVLSDLVKYARSRAEYHMVDGEFKSGHGGDDTSGGFADE